MASGGNLGQDERTRCGGHTITLEYSVCEKAIVKHCGFDFGVHTRQVADCRSDNHALAANCEDLEIIGSICIQSENADLHDPVVRSRRMHGAFVSDSQALDQVIAFGV